MSLCHHTVAAGSFARHLKLLYEPYARGKIFLDSDELDRLDAIFITVSSDGSNLVLLGTKCVLTRFWWAGETPQRSRPISITCGSIAALWMSTTTSVKSTRYGPRPRKYVCPAVNERGYVRGQQGVVGLTVKNFAR